MKNTIGKWTVMGWGWRLNMGYREINLLRNGGIFGSMT